MAASGKTSISSERYPWGTALALFGLGFIALFLALPFLPNIIILLPGAILLAGVVSVGLLLLKAAGLPAPWLGLRQPLDYQSSPLRRVAVAALAGTGLGLVMLILLRFLFVSLAPQLQSRFAAEAHFPAWQRLLIAFDSAVLEELIFRLFLVSLLVWLLSRWWKTANGRPGSRSLWMAAGLVAVGFGLAHLSQWAAVTALTSVVIGMVVLLNSIGGIVFGYLYFTYGIEAAMVAHFMADVVLHIVGLEFWKV